MAWIIQFCKCQWTANWQYNSIAIELYFFLFFGLDFCQRIRIMCVFFQMNAFRVGADAFPKSGKQKSQKWPCCAEANFPAFLNNWGQMTCGFAHWSPPLGCTRNLSTPGESDTLPLSQMKQRQQQQSPWAVTNCDDVWESIKKGFLVHILSLNLTSFSFVAKVNWTTNLWQEGGGGELVMKEERTS